MPVIGLDQTRTVNFQENRLELLARRIAAAHDRVTKGDEEWVEASLELASALIAGREAMSANIAFSLWLKERQLDYYSKNDRAALIEIGSDIELGRKLLSATKSRCYQVIWSEHKSENSAPVKDLSRLPKNRKTAGQARKKRTCQPRGRRDLFRRAKLGDALVDQIKGTSLESAEEIDELVMLNRGAPPEEHTPIVKQLVADAIAGKPVSALAYTAQTAATHHKPQNLLAIWNKRMVFAWTQASKAEKHKLVEFLMDQVTRKD